MRELVPEESEPRWWASKNEGAVTSKNVRRKVKIIHTSNTGKINLRRKSQLTRKANSSEKKSPKNTEGTQIRIQLAPKKLSPETRSQNEVTTPNRKPNLKTKKWCSQIKVPKKLFLKINPRLKKKKKWERERDQTIMTATLFERERGKKNEMETLKKDLYTNHNIKPKWNKGKTEI